MKLFIQHRNSSLYFFLICIITLCACKKNKEVTNASAANNTDLLSVIENYYKLTTTRLDGKFIFESNLCDNDPSHTDIVTAGGAFYDRQGNAVNNGGGVIINNMTLSDYNGTFLLKNAVSQNGLYGTNVKFSVKPPSDGLTRATTTDATATLYSPLPISITNIQPGNSLVLRPNMPTYITWNADANNPNGVVIMAEYIPSRSPNRNIASGGATRLIENSQLVSDNGSYSIPWNFFAFYPVGGHVILWVARGNYTIASNGVYNYEVGGYTAAAVWDVIVPATLPTIIATNIAGVTGFTAKYTNTATGVQTTFSIPGSGGSLGTLTPGNYNVTISKIGNATKYYLAACDNGSVNTSVTVNNVAVNSTCNTITISPPNQIP
jgi:hypothetical protein